MPMCVVRRSASETPWPSGTQISAPGRLSFMKSCSSSRAPLSGPPRLQPLPDAGLFLFLHPGQRAEAPVRDGDLEVFGRAYPELAEHEAHPLGAQAGHLQEVEQAPRDLGQQIVVIRTAAGLDHLPQLGRDAAAHARDRAEVVPAADHLRHVLAVAPDGLRAQAVRADAEEALALD